MTEILNFYLQKYGLLEPKIEGNKNASNEKAKLRWDLLRKSIRSVSALLTKEDLKNNKISHGISFVRRINGGRKIVQASFLTGKETYLTLDGETVNIFDNEGKYKRSVSYSEIGASFTRLEWAPGSDRFVAWNPGSCSLAMLDDAFKVVEIVDESLVQDPIFQMCYNESRGEIISSHSSKVMIWKFRYAEKHLIPEKCVSVKFKDDVAPTILVLEKIQGQDQRLFLVNDCGTVTVGVVTGSVLCRHQDMHERPITAITFLDPVKVLVTGSRDGSIKVWTPLDQGQMDLVMVFVGHTDSVSALAPFPGVFQAKMMSCGLDRTLRVWNLEINDEVECLHLGYQSRTIDSDPSRTSFFTLDCTSLDIWTQNQVLEELVTLASPATHLEGSLYDSTSVLVSCKNNLFFLASSSESTFDPLTRTLVSKTHIPELTTQEKVTVLSSVVLDSDNLLFLLINKNIILQYDLETNPMVLKRKSQCLLDQSLLMLTLYKCQGESKTKSLLMSGSSDGFIIVHDLVDPGLVLFKMDAHFPDAVATLESNPGTSRLFSSGHDKSIKVWHVYPFASEPLTRELSFFCGQLAVGLACVDEFLFAVFSDPEGDQFPAVIYNVQDRSRYDHSPNDDHVEPVICVRGAPKMKLFLSCSSGQENLVKVWTCKNVLLRQIETHFPVHCVAFCSERADILVSVGNQICRISHQKYLPKAYLKKQVLMNFEHEHKTHPGILWNEAESERLFSTKDREILGGVKGVPKYNKYEDVLPKNVDNKLHDTKKSLEKIKSVEEDIQRLKQGHYEKQKRKYSKFLEKPKKEDILKAYVAEMTRFCEIMLPEESIEGDESIDGGRRRKRRGVGEEKYRGSDKMGFFPSSKTLSKDSYRTLNPQGYIPNSSILSRIWPTDMIREKADMWKEPLLSTLDLALARARARVIPEMEEDSPRFFDWESDDEDKDEKVQALSPLDKEIPDQISDDVLSKFSSLSVETKVPKEDQEGLKEVQNLDPKSEPVKRTMTTTLSRESLKLPAIPRAPATMPDLRKVRFPEAPSPSEPFQDEEELKESLGKGPIFITQSVTEDFSVNQSMIDDRSINQSVVEDTLMNLPRFLAPFFQESWFQRMCLEGLPSPLTASTFTRHLLDKMERKGEDTLALIGAIGRMYSDQDLDRATVLLIHSAMSKVVEEDTEDPLLRASLGVMASLEGVPDRFIVTLCLSKYLDSPEDEDFQRFLKSLLYHLGLEDPGDIVPRELEATLKPGFRRGVELQEMVGQCLQRWFQALVNFASECRTLIGPEIRLLDSHGTRKCSRDVASCLAKVMDVFHLNITNQADFILLYPPDKCPKSVLTYINCLNFVRYQRSKKERKIQRSQEKSFQEEGPLKTIMSLPKIDPNQQCLVRLGESNADRAKIDKKKDLSIQNSMWSKRTITDPTQHPAMQPLHHYQIAVGGGFVPYLHLHMKPCFVNPFPRPDQDMLEWESINSKSLFMNAKQTFLHQFSLPPEPF